jgi:DNA adenine methylase
MRYFGGKAKIAKELSVVLNKYLENNDKPFIDAFCGSCNIVSKIDDKRIRIANDKHKELIAMWQWVKKMGVERLPTDVSRELYYYVKTSTTSPDWLKGFVGFGCSFAGKWWGGYAGQDERTTCSYATNAYNSIKKKMVGLKDVSFTCGNYFDITIPAVPSIIYCDIPYKNTTSYSNGTFNHEQFYAWAYSMKALGHIVLVSEYEMNVEEAMRVNIVWRKESRKDIRDGEGKQQSTTEVLIQI